MKTFQGGVAVVTGSGSGIGRALALRAAREGMNVVLADVDEQGMAETASLVTTKGVEILPVKTDVADVAQVQALADLTVKRFGKVSLLCNNAGVGGFQRFLTTSIESWQWQMGVNLYGPIFGCRTFIPILAREPEAHILNTASMSGFLYSPFLTPYSVTKAGVIALTEGLFRELHQDYPTIAISSLCPAFTATNIADDERAAPDHIGSRSDADPSLEDMRDNFRNNLHKGQDPNEVAQIAFDGMRSGLLHIFPQPEWIERVESRIKAITEGRPIEAGFTGGLKTEGELARD